MINSIQGKILLKKNNYIILENNGIGYKIYINSWIFELKKEDELFLWTYQVVKENALDLFGFKTFNELEIFELLIGISGIGPKVALSIMDITTPTSLKTAVISENTDELTKVSGIGKKNAQKIILELKNKIKKIKLDQNEKLIPFDIDLFETLEALGFQSNEIRNVLKEVQNITPSKRLKEALKILGKNK